MLPRFAIAVSALLSGVFDSADAVNYDNSYDFSNERKYGYESRPGPKVIDLEALDPRNQGVSSSYSVVETNAPGRIGKSPLAGNYEKEFFENSGEFLSRERGVSSTTTAKPVRKKKKKSSPVSSTTEGEYSAKAKDYTSKNQALYDADFKETLNKKNPETYLDKSKKPAPKSINEIVGHVPLQVAGSDHDLKKSGSLLGGVEGDAYDEGYGKEKHFDKEAAKKFVEKHQAEKGEKAEKGYKKEEGFEKGKEAKHGKEEKKAEVAEKEGEKKGHVEQDKVFGEAYKGTHGEKGVQIKKKTGQKKGHKKSGFHKVHHKDEYKKDEVFYDESHDGDEKEEHAQEHEKHAKEKGGSEKKTHVDSAYHEGHAEKKGVQDKGKHFEEAAAHKKEAGQEAHHADQAEYGKKGGLKEGQKHGHAEGASSGGGYKDHGSSFFD